ADVAGVYSLDFDRIAGFEGFGETSVQNLRDAIDRSRQRPLGRLLFGLRIPHVGTTVADQLARAFGSLGDLEAAGVEEIEAVEGLGPVIAASVHGWMHDRTNAGLLDRLRAAGVDPEASVPAATGVPQVLEGMAVVVTGTLEGMGRDEARDAITSRGGRSPGSVSAKTTALVAGEGSGSKLVKAEQLGVPVLDEAAFTRLLESGSLPGQ
ncbi:MAG: helix-hairpin-helix domain-containing protein, partial [Acidimicrobiales bacterium]|nr:helix-hairpin-helix domain-containing protein [Acidimicrobiales bacterium]